MEEVQQHERATPTLCNFGQTEQPGETVAVLGHVYVLHPEAVLRGPDTDQASGLPPMSAAECTTDLPHAEQ